MIIRRLYTTKSKWGSKNKACTKSRYTHNSQITKILILSTQYQKKKILQHFLKFFLPSNYFFCKLRASIRKEHEYINTQKLKISIFCFSRMSEFNHQRQNIYLYCCSVKYINKTSVIPICFSKTNSSMHSNQALLNELCDTLRRRISCVFKNTEYN